MAGEVTVPLLPCASLDDVQPFYEALGFRKTYRQLKPNPYLAMRREDIELHFFGMDGFDPADSYGTCIVQVPDTRELHTAFADGLRGAYGKVPLSGIPRMTRPRRRKNAENLSGFTVIDPGGNWIRIFPAAAPVDDAEPADKLARATANAVVLADSHGDVPQAAKILDGALRRAGEDPGGTPASLVEALAYRAELALTLDDPERAASALAQLKDIELSTEDRRRLAEPLAAAEELRARLGG